MKSERVDWTTAGLFCLLLWALFGTNAELAEPDQRPEPPNVPTALFEDVRLELPPDVFELVKTFIQTGRIQSGRVGLDSSSLKRMEFEGGTIQFVPPLRVEYDGPGPLNAATTVERVTIDAAGAILIDVVNSPIDLKIETQTNVETVF
jgi:hypothetical protein